MDDLDQASPEEHRARYEALKFRAAARLATRAAGREPAEITDIVWREQVPPSAYATVRIARGDSFRLIDITGVTSISWLAWNADEPSERYNAGDTVKLQWTARLTTGRLLFSDMGRVLASITADTACGHDPLIGGSTRATVARAGGTGRSQSAERNARDNLVLAAARFGLGVADVPTPIAFFADLCTDENGRFVWRGERRSGRLVELRAEMNLLVALSNTSHPLDPARGCGPVDAIVWRSPPPAADDPARHGGEEAQRGFENTDRLFLGATR